MMLKFKILITLTLLAHLSWQQYSYVTKPFWFLPPVNVSTLVTNRTCPLPFPQGGAFCCENGPYMYSMPISQKDFTDILALFPENRGSFTTDQINRRKAYLDPKLDPNIYMGDEGGYLDFTLLDHVSSNRNQIGVFLFNENKAIIPNTKMDVFSDVTLADSRIQPKTTYCHSRGDTVRIGPFEPNARVGLYIHVNGANIYPNTAACTKNNTKLIECLRARNAFDQNTYKCYTDFQCYYEPNADNGANNYFTIDSLNRDKLRHVAVITLLDQTTGITNIYYGFEDAYGGGDRDYNDVVVRIQTMVGQPNLPKVCNPPCDSINGFCDYVSGTCQCNTKTPLIPYNGTSCRCECGCRNGASCLCTTGVCQCPTGFTGTYCQCLSDSGFCKTTTFGTGSVTPTWSMSFACTNTSSVCNCADSTKYVPSFGFTSQFGNMYKVGFGPVGTSLTDTELTHLDTGISPASGINFSSLGTFGWDRDMRNQVRVSFTAARSFIYLPQGPIWTIVLRPVTFYDIQVVLGGDSVNTVNSLNVIHQFNTSAIIAAGLTVSAGSTTILRTRVRTPPSGILQFWNPNSASTTALSSITITRSACSCTKCGVKNTCNGKGECDCDTGSCICDPNWRGSSDCSCATPKGICLNGGTMQCATGTCNCSSNWEGDLCERHVCKFPGCNENGGNCSIVDGTCTCPITKSGPNCGCNFPQNLVCQNGGTKNCTSGVCNCPYGWKGNDCSCKSICPNDCAGNGVCQCDGTCACPPDWLGQSTSGELDCSCKTPVKTCVHGTYNCTSGICKCRLGYAGVGCDEVLKCGSNGNTVCQNNGTCNYTTGICICPSGFIYNDCSCKACTQTCNPSNSVFQNQCNCDGTCVCKPGFYGPSCDYKYCPSPCLNGGSCTLNGTCDCIFPYFGPTCKSINCNPACVSENTEVCDTNVGKCNCKNLFYGPSCEFKNCSSPCENGGSCTLSGTCSCVEPFFGDRCELKKCQLADCKAGSCDYSQGACVCDVNWSKQSFDGPCNCSSIPCLSQNDKPCSGHGACNCRRCTCEPGWTGPDCGCTTQSCLNGCSGHGSCECGICYCNSNWTSPDCSIPTCPKNELGVTCNGRGSCNENNGTCTCDENWSGPGCTNVCIKDPCGDCNGNGQRCLGCDGIFNSGSVFDVCMVCGGDNKTCSGCDGLPFSGLVKDACGVCGGDGTTCRQEKLCNQRTSCTSCNQVSISTGKQLCGWCNSTGTCHDLRNISISSCKSADVCQIISTNITINDSLTSNGETTTTFFVVGGISSAFLVGAAFAALLFFNHRRNMQEILSDQVWANSAVSNPLYRNINSTYENPLYRRPKQQEEDEDNGY